jgi:hypothetical protein
MGAMSYEVQDMNEFIELVYEKGWTDGPPVFPPTEDKVAEMMNYIKRSPDEVIGVLPPGEGVITIEKVAINAVMAGCKPEYLPVIITAIEGMLEPSFEILRVQATTAGPSPLVIVSGPVVAKLGFNYETGSFTGTGHRVNSTIGRAIRLILWNVGYGRPGKLAMSVFGHPGRYCYLVAERPPEDQNPWEPYHVTAGLKPEDSAVSVFPAVNHYQINAAFGNQTFENSMFVIKDSIIHLGNFRAANPKLFVINPQAVKLLTEQGWDKIKFRDYVIEMCKRRVGDVKRTGGLSVTYKNHWSKVADPDDDEAMVPAMMPGQGLQVLVSGGWGSASSQCLWIDSVHGTPNTKKINWKWD